MRQIIAANWKMNGLAADAKRLTQSLRQNATGLPCDLVICPPFTRIAMVAEALSGTGIGVGSQDCHQAASGPYTGDISAAMVAEAGARYVIVGHSERRLGHGETDEVVRQKTKAALAGGLIPIVCVGESADQRGGGQAHETVGWQIEGSLPEGFEGILAYEPVWAIGAGNSADEDDVAAMHAFIHDELTRQFPDSVARLAVLYGGSVKPDNAAGLLALPNVDGALVGGASLDASDFIAIARAAAAR